MAVAAETVLEAYKAVLGFAGSAIADKPSLGKTNPSTFGGLLNKAGDLDKLRDQVDAGGRARPAATPSSGGSAADPGGTGGIRSRNGQPSFVEELVKSAISPGSRFATLPDGAEETGDDGGRR